MFKYNLSSWYMHAKHTHEVLKLHLETTKMSACSYSEWYNAYDQAIVSAQQQRAHGAHHDAFQAFMHRARQTTTIDGFQRMQRCRDALAVLDKQGWQRSYHQRLFHDNFMRACARVFFKADGPGAFARAHQGILDLNGWDNLAHEVLISTPRRFGKTMAVSMFAAAMLYSTAQVELSIYSTCKRISQKLLRNIHKFLDLIYEGNGEKPMRVHRSNMEELIVVGPESSQDLRIVNSYPSKVPLCNIHGDYTHVYCRRPQMLTVCSTVPVAQPQLHASVHTAFCAGMLWFTHVPPQLASP